jgi:hypothetical protein
MKIIELGHIYALTWLDGEPQQDENHLIFVNREGCGVRHHPGTQCQEVIRALIDRVQHCDAQLRWEGNDEIVEHLREALVLFEARALIRKTEKGLLHPETIVTGDDGHFKLVKDEP